MRLTIQRLVALLALSLSVIAPAFAQATVEKKADDTRSISVVVPPVASATSAPKGSFSCFGTFAVNFAKGRDKGAALMVINAINTGKSDATEAIDIQYLRLEIGRMVVFDTELIKGKDALGAFLAGLDLEANTKHDHAAYAYEYEPRVATAFISAVAGTTDIDAAASRQTSLSSLGYNGPVHVKGYTRKDGTYVRSHTRSAPGGGSKRGGRKH